MNDALPTKIRDFSANQARQALTIVKELVESVSHGRPADEQLAQIFRQNRKCGSRDRRFISQLVFSYFRWKGWLNDLPLPEACGLAYQVDAEEPHPTIRHLLSKEIPPLGAMNLAQKIESLGQYLNRSLQLDDLFPSWLKKELFYPDDTEPNTHFSRVVESFQQRPPTWLRANQGQALKVAQALTVSSFTNSALANAIGFYSPLQLDLVRKKIGSCFEVQDIASQCVGLVCDPKAGKSWWDVCAGAGGKSLHLADLMRGTGKILATDVRDAALEELQRRARMGGVRSIETMSLDNFKSEKKFDGVLVDAPCSGIGTWSRNPDARWRISEKTVTEKATTQLKILSKAALNVKTKGHLIYAVCTITARETRGVITQFLNQHKNFRLIPTIHPLRQMTTSGEVWVWPWDGPCDGMYIAMMQNIT